jgi:hypothetical protein
MGRTVYLEQFRSAHKTRRSLLWQVDRAVDRLWEEKVQHEAARVHYAARRGGGMAACGKGAVADARDRFS